MSPRIAYGCPPKYENSIEWSLANKGEYRDIVPDFFSFVDSNDSLSLTSVSRAIVEGKPSK